MRIFDWITGTTSRRELRRRRDQDNRWIRDKEDEKKRKLNERLKERRKRAAEAAERRKEERKREDKTRKQNAIEFLRNPPKSCYCVPIVTAMVVAAISVIFFGGLGPTTTEITAGDSPTPQATAAAPEGPDPTPASTTAPAFLPTTVPTTDSGGEAPTPPAPSPTVVPTTDSGGEAPAAPAPSPTTVPSAAPSANPTVTSAPASEPTPTAESSATPLPTATTASTPTPVPTATAEPTPTPEPTATLGPTATPEPVVVPLAWAQSESVLCSRDADNQRQADAITTSFIVRDQATGQDLITQYEGATATLTATGNGGSFGQASTTVSNASMFFRVNFSAPAQPTETLALELDINGTPVSLSAPSTAINLNACEFP